MKHCPACRRTYATHFTVCPQDGTALRDAAELAPGTVLRGKYEILEKLGEGGMGVVFKVRHVRFDEICALKVVSAALAQDQTFVQRFHAEALVMRKLEHPHALRVHDVDETEDGRPFLVMEFVAGQNLATLLRAGPLEPARAVRIAVQLCEALAAAHRLGIIHRDIKPNNILLARAADGSDFVKLFDFGIAKVKEGSAIGGGASLTQTGFLVGTPAYMSPEQARGLRGDKLDGRSDLYSLGVVLYEMLTGRIPFEGDTPLAVLMAHLNQAPPELQHLRAGLPDALVEIVMTALAKDPEERFAAAEAMRASLAQVLQLLTSGVTQQAAPARAVETRVWTHEPAPHISPVPTSRVATPPPAPPRAAPPRRAEETPRPMEKSFPAPALSPPSDMYQAPNRTALVLSIAGLLLLVAVLAVWRLWVRVKEATPLQPAPSVTAPAAETKAPAPPPRPAVPAPGPAAKASKPLEEEVSKATAERPESKPAEEKETEEPRQQPPAEQSPPAAVRTEYTMEEYNEYVRAANERDPATRRRLLEEFLAKNARSALVPYAQRLLKESAPPQRLRFAGNDSRLKMVHHVQPVYPPLARKAGIGGTVRLQVVIGTDGLVKETAVLEGHPLLVQAALDAVRQWLYQPIILNGQPVEVVTTLDVFFNPSGGQGIGPGPGGGIGGGIGGGAFVAGRDGVTTPNCISCPRPSFTEQALRAKYQGFVTLRIVVTTEGRATSITFIRRAGFGLDEAAVRAVSQWKFEPARGPDGRPVAVWVPLEVNFKML